MNFHWLLFRYAEFLHGADELLELLLRLLGFFLDDGDDDGFWFCGCRLRYWFRFDAHRYGCSRGGAARAGVDERFGVGREGRFGDGLFRDGAVAFRVDEGGRRNGGDFVQEDGRRRGELLRVLRLGCVLRGRMVVVVMMVLLLLLGRRRLLVLRWKRFDLLVVLRVRIVCGLLFLVLVGFDFDGGSVGDG